MIPNLTTTLNRVPANGIDDAAELVSGEGFRFTGDPPEEPAAAIRALFCSISTSRILSRSSLSEVSFSNSSSIFGGVFTCMTSKMG